MNKMVIVDPNAYGGHNDFCHSLSLLLANKGSEVIYLNREYKSNNSTDYEHVAAGYSDEYFMNKIKSYRNMYHYLKAFTKKGYAIHFQAINVYLIPVIFLLLMQPKTQKSFYFTMHNMKPHGKDMKERVEYKIVYLLLRLDAFKKIFYHFEFIKPDDALTVSLLPVSVRKKMVFIPHHMFHEIVQDMESIQLVERKDQEIIILFFGDIRRNKGLLEFFTLLTESEIDTKGVKFIVAGKFSEYSDSELQKILDQSKYEINVQIDNRFISDEEKEQLFKDAHYILLPYLDSFLAQSGVVLDAYQYQKPLIVSTNPSLKYLVTHELTGYLYDQESLKALLTQGIYDQEKYDSMAESINYMLQSKYSDEYIANLYQSEYFQENR